MSTLGEGKNEERFIVLHRGRTPVGRPTTDYRAAMQRAYDLVADVDVKKLSPKERDRTLRELSYDIVDA